MKLTKKLIDSFTYKGPEGPKPRRDVRWDEQLPGFGVRIYPSGHKAYILSYRYIGRKRLMKLADVGIFTLSQARDLARKTIARVINDEDPLEEREKAKRGETIRNLCEAYLERHAKIHKKSWRRDERQIKQFINPAWGAHKVEAIKRRDVAALHHMIGIKRGTPYEANRTISMLSKMFALAKQWGYLEESAPNPARNIQKFKEEKRDRWITVEELPRLAKAIEEEQNFYARAAIWLYLLTGLRRSELLSAKWDDVDWNRKEICIPDTKSGQKHYLPLSKRAHTLLEFLPHVEGNPYILPGKKEGSHLINITKPWYRIRKRAGIEDVRLHDLRRTVGSWMAQDGKSLHLIGRVLNHKKESTTAIYARFGQDNVREALESHAQKLISIAKVELPKVITS